LCRISEFVTDSIPQGKENKKLSFSFSEVPDLG